MIVKNNQNLYKFLILSNQPFDLPLKTNKWHIATRLAERGNKVLFVDPPLRFKALKEYLKHPSFNISKLFFRTEKKTKNLLVYKPANIFNFWPFSSFSTWMHSRKVAKYLSTMSQSENQVKTVVWIYHFDYPDLKNFLKKLKYDLLIYDVVDEYTAFPEYSERKTVNTGLVAKLQWIDDELKIRINQNGVYGVKWVLQVEEWLAKNVDLMFASAPGLVTKFKKWRNQVAYLPNGAAVDKFDFPRASLPEPKDIANIPHPRIGFSGAIDNYKNNIKLIEKCAEKLDKFHFILIGPEKVADPDLDLSKLKKMNNVHFLGLKAWEETPKYFNHFDAYFIPYNLNDYTVKGCFPVKYFEALASGLPTIVTDLPAYNGFDPDGYVSKTDEEFVNNLKRAVEEDSPAKINKRKQMAKQNSWDGKVEKQLALIDEFFAK